MCGISTFELNEHGAMHFIAFIYTLYTLYMCYMAGPCTFIFIFYGCSGYLSLRSLLLMYANAVACLYAN